MDHANILIDDILFVDTETRTHIDIKTAGTVKYATNAQMILGGFMLGDRYFVYDIHENRKIPDWVFEHIRSGGPVCAHNYLFDYLILKQYIPELTLEQGIDTAAMCAAHSLPLSLEKAGNAINLESDKKKLADGKRLIKRFCIPDSEGNYCSALTHPVEWSRFREYLDNDIVAMKEIFMFVPPLTPFQFQTWLDTQYVNLDGIPMDAYMIQHISERLDPLVDEESSKFIRLTGLFPSQNARIIAWANALGCNLPNLQAATVADFIADPTTPEIVRQALEIRTNTSHASFKKYDTMKAAMMEDNHIRGCFLYHVATTGRWGGRLLQPHNLTKGKIDGEEAVEKLKAGEFTVELVKSAVRPMIHCDEGFTIVDYAGIEARVVQWLAEDEEALGVFRRGLDPYKWMAQRIYSVGYDDVTDRQRFAGKQAILGLGYSMSWKKFQETVLRYGEHLTAAECKQVVEVYRQTHSKLVAFWNTMMRGWCMAMQRPNVPHTVNRHVAFQYSDPFMYMILPSGRRLAYPAPSIVPSASSYDLEYSSENIGGQWVRERTYGGKLVENAVQAISADILAIAVRRLLERGYRVPMHVHDEIVVRGNIGVEHMIEVMCELPDWAAGLPLTAEGEYVTRYKKL